MNEFVEMCHQLRVLNGVRHSSVGIPITFRQYPVLCQWLCLCVYVCMCEPVRVYVDRTCILAIPFQLLPGLLTITSVLVLAFPYLKDNVARSLS